jgi:hypothetical protein
MRRRSLRRYIHAGLAVATLAGAAALAAPAKLAAGDPFPILDTHSVTGTHVVLPAASHDVAFVAILAFSQKAGDESAKWSHALYKALPSDVGIYAVADLSHVPGLFRGFAIGGIKKQASPMQPEHRNHVLLLTAKNDWSQIVPSGSDDDAVIVEVDHDGKITTIVRRAFTDDAASDLAKAVPRP